MTVTPAPALTAAEARIVAAFEAAPTPPEVTEAAVIEEVARAIREGLPATISRTARNRLGRRLAVAAVTAYRATQDGGAEEAVRRVEALAETWDLLDGSTGEIWRWDAAARIRAALAPQAVR